jgi:hypothetical protein
VAYQHRTIGKELVQRIGTNVGLNDLQSVEEAQVLTISITNFTDELSFKSKILRPFVVVCGGGESQRKSFRRYATDFGSEPPVVSFFKFPVVLELGPELLDDVAVDHFRRDCLDRSYCRRLGQGWSRIFYVGFFCSGPSTGLGLGLASSVSEAHHELPLFTAHL